MMLIQIREWIEILHVKYNLLISYSRQSLCSLKQLPSGTRKCYHYNSEKRDTAFLNRVQFYCYSKSNFSILTGHKSVSITNSKQNNAVTKVSAI
jgi:hypothetical protein